MKGERGRRGCHKFKRRGAQGKLFAAAPLLVFLIPLLSGASSYSVGLRFLVPYLLGYLDLVRGKHLQPLGQVLHPQLDALQLVQSLQDGAKQMSMFLETMNCQINSNTLP